MKKQLIFLALFGLLLWLPAVAQDKAPADTATLAATWLLWSALLLLTPSWPTP